MTTNQADRILATLESSRDFHVHHYPGFWEVNSPHGNFRGCSLRDALAQYAQVLIYAPPSAREYAAQRVTIPDLEAVK
jgi:hypothetical protein